MGFHPKATPHVPVQTLAPNATSHLTTLQQEREEALAAYNRAQMRMSKWQTPIQKYHKGECVWLEGTNITLQDLPRKLAPRRYSPFVITEVLSAIAYQLQLPKHWKVHNIFHTSLLSPVREDSARPIETQPLPNIIDNQEK